MRIFNSRPARRRLLIITAFVISLLFFLQLRGEFIPEPIRVPIASAKGVYVRPETIALNALEDEAVSFAAQNATFSNLLSTMDLEFLYSEPLGYGEARDWTAAGCRVAPCSHTTYYNYSDGGTVELIIRHDTGTVVDVWQNLSARPNASEHVVNRVLAIAAADKKVQNTLGDLGALELAMVPMSIWLIADDCLSDWCVDLTFAAPDGSGRVLHVAVNMQQNKVARLFYTRAREDRSLHPDDVLAQVETPTPDFTDGCHTAYGWDVCWEMTGNDAINFFDAAYEEQIIFSSAKIGQVEVYYPSWPGGYRDELGSRTVVPARGDTHITDLGNGFEVRQLFTEPYDWPNCTCCYRYHQIITFYDDGSFEPGFIAHGPGCAYLSEYRPFWRIDLEAGDPESNEVHIWDKFKWIEVEAELDTPLFSGLGPDDVRLHVASQPADVDYQLVPLRTDPLDQDDGRLFILQYMEFQGDGPIEAGQADTFVPPLQWLGDDPVFDQNVVIWYIAILKTRTSDPWWCVPDPAPDFSPCFASMLFKRSGELQQPIPGAVQVPDEVPTPAPPETATPSVATTPAATTTPRHIGGSVPAEVVANAGCGACHTISQLGWDGQVGPNLSNIGQVAGERQAGISAADYLRQSILEPTAYIAPNCPNGPCLEIMQSYAGTLSPDQVETLVNYLLTLTADIDEDGESRPITGPAATPFGPTPDQEMAIVNAGLVIVLAVVILGILGILLTRRSM